MPLADHTMSQTISQPPFLSPDLPGTTAASAPTDALDTLLHGVAVAPITERGWIRITGEDRDRWLNGMVTNAVAGLAEGEGCYNFFLNAQGQIQGDGTVFRAGRDLLLETGAEAITPLLEMLERFIIMDDVELADISADREGVLLAGPGAPSLIAQLVPEAPDVPQLSLCNTPWRDASLTIIHVFSPLIPRFELWGPPATIAALREALAAQRVSTADQHSLECLRILEGIPRFGTDIRGRELPQETAQTRALHFNKGCYLGQEIVERIRSRGKVHRTFTGLLLTGALPAPGVEVLSGTAPVGVLTSIADLAPSSSPFPPGVYPALGYLRRDAVEGAHELTYIGGRAIPTALPFRLGGTPESKEA